MAMSEEERRRRRRKQAKRRRRERGERNKTNKRLLKQAMELTAANATDQQIDPLTGLELVLHRTYSWLVYAVDRVENLPEDEFWRKTPENGQIPNEWIRFEQDLRQEFGKLAARMLDLDIEARKTTATEAIAAMLVPVLQGVIKDLKLTPAQKEKAPEILRTHLRVLEQSPSPRLGANAED